MDTQTEDELKELATSRLLLIRTADHMEFVNDPYFELTNLPLALIDLKDIPRELKTSFNVLLDIDLTVQQARIALMISSGFTYDYIAEILKITKATASNHRSDLFTKILKLHNDNPENANRYDTRVLISLVVNRLLNQLQ